MKKTCTWINVIQDGKWSKSTITDREEIRMYLIYLADLVCWSKLFFSAKLCRSGKKNSGQNIDCREPLEKHLLIHLRKSTLLYYSNISGLCLILQTSTSPYYPCFFFFQTAVFTLNGCYTDVNCLQFITLDYSFSWKMTHMSCLICVCWSSKQFFVRL